MVTSLPGVPERGDAIWIDFDPQAGREQAGRRPAVVLSPAAYNGKVGLALLCPVTSQVKGYPFEVGIPNGLPVAGVILRGSGEEPGLAQTERDADRGAAARHGCRGPAQGQRATDTGEIVTTFDIATTEGLRDACREAERRLDQQGETIAEHAEFLRRVRDASAEERENERFQHLIWEENPLAGLGQGEYDVSAALADQGFRRWFLRTDPRSLAGGVEGENCLAGRSPERDDGPRASVRASDARRPAGNRPVWKTQRAFAALFPNDIIPYYHYSLYQLVAHGMGKSGMRPPPCAGEPVDPRPGWPQPSVRWILSTAAP